MYQMRKNLKWSALRSGVLITLAFVLTFVVILNAGTLRQAFAPTVELQAQFRDVKGLRKGAPVWLFGTEVGSVKDIRLDTMYGTIVTLSIERSAEPFIRSNSKAEILAMGLLGDKYVELLPGLPEAPPLHRGALIEGRTPMELSGMVETSNRAVHKISQFVGKMDELVEKIVRGEGTLSKFIHDPALYNSLTRSAGALESTLERLERSRGTLRLLIEDRSLYDRALSSVSGIERVMRKLETGQGSLGRMVTDPGLYETLNRAAKDLDAVLDAVNNGDGMARALLHDGELVGQVKGSLAEIRMLTDQLKRLLKNIEEHPDRYFRFSLF